MRATPSERYATAEGLLVDLQSIDATGGTTSTPPAHQDGLWWWQFHQTVVAVVNAAVPVMVWAVRRWIALPFGRPLASTMFLIALALAAISVTLRLNLSFTSRVHPDLLIEHRARLFPAIAIADALLAIALIVSAATIAGMHDEIAAVFVSVAVVMLASLGLIEPATTKAAGLSQK
jgi:hypothetical protein